MWWIDDGDERCGAGATGGGGGGGFADEFQLQRQCIIEPLHSGFLAQWLAWSGKALHPASYACGQLDRWGPGAVGGGPLRRGPCTRPARRDRPEYCACRPQFVP